MDNRIAIKRLASIFHEDSPRALRAGLQRLVADEILLRQVRTALEQDTS